MAGEQNKLIQGLESPDFCDMNSVLHNMSQNGFEFVITPLTHPRYKEECLGTSQPGTMYPFARVDMTISSKDWGVRVVGKLAPWLSPDSEDDKMRRISEIHLDRELVYANHLGLTAVWFSLKSYNCANTARLFNVHRYKSESYQVQLGYFIHVRMCNSDASGDETRNSDPWYWWDKFRTLNNSCKQIGIALELTADVPSKLVVDRWFSEPVRCLVIPTHVFINNRSNFPVLPKVHQAIVQRFFKLNIQVVITGACYHERYAMYREYINHLYVSRGIDCQSSQFGQGYEDFLQHPLQPLMDNLESGTYEIFEKDPVKYTEYQRAITMALTDKGKVEGRDPAEPLVVMVVGAGRGPLVRATLAASEQTQVPVKLTAVEKNPNAIVTLLWYKETYWGDRVNVVASDMRNFRPDEQADIIVSELLGSFGDNELSPECLDGVEGFLKPDGISIPCAYSSYIAPVQSHKLYSQTQASRELDKHPLSAFEMPFVVLMTNVNELDEPQRLFTFEHPSPNKDNSRYGVRRFQVKKDSVLHGIAGYFDTVLYKDVTLSIVPRTHSPGMFSWFPIFFPLKTPIRVKEGEEIEINFWRCVSERKVWYEWCVTEPVVGNVHNPAGRSYFIGL